MIQLYLFRYKHADAASVLFRMYNTERDGGNPKGMWDAFLALRFDASFYMLEG